VRSSERSTSDAIWVERRRRCRASWRIICTSSSVRRKASDSDARRNLHRLIIAHWGYFWSPACDGRGKVHDNLQACKSAKLTRFQPVVFHSRLPKGRNEAYRLQCLEIPPQTTRYDGDRVAAEASSRLPQKRPAERLQGTINGLAVEIDLPAMIDRVYISPAAPSWFAKLVEAQTAKNGFGFPVSQSELAAAPLY